MSKTLLDNPLEVRKIIKDFVNNENSEFREIYVNLYKVYSENRFENNPKFIKFLEFIFEKWA